MRFMVAQHSPRWLVRAGSGSTVIALIQEAASTKQSNKKREYETRCGLHNGILHLSTDWSTAQLGNLLKGAGIQFVDIATHLQPLGMSEAFQVAVLLGAQRLPATDAQMVCKGLGVPMGAVCLYIRCAACLFREARFSRTTFAA